MQRKIAALAIAGLMAGATMPVFGGDGFGYTATSSAMPPRKGIANRKQKRKAQKLARRKNRAKK